MTTDTPELDPALVEVAARAMFKHHCGPDADLDESNGRVPDTIYNAETDEDEPLDPDDWEPYLTDLWEGWARAALAAVLPSLRAQVAAEVVGPVLALAEDWDRHAAVFVAEVDLPTRQDWEFRATQLRALVTDPDAVSRHEAGVKAAAWREAADEWEQCAFQFSVFPSWLRARADEVTR